MTTLSKPVTWGRTIYVGTDHLWMFRRVDSIGAPIVPSSARAQVRSSRGGELWVECDTEIDPEGGWITVSIPAAETADDTWGEHVQGVWDVEVVVAGQTLRWVEGTVRVSGEVTR